MEIENRLHCVLVLTFNEDRRRIGMDCAPVNLDVLRYMNLIFLKQEKTAKGGIKAQRLQAAWDDSYLLKTLAS